MLPTTVSLSLFLISGLPNLVWTDANFSDCCGAKAALHWAEVAEPVADGISCSELQARCIDRSDIGARVWIRPANAETVEQSGIPPEYAQCQDILTSHPANTLSEFVAKGYGAKIATGDLGSLVKGLRCSDAQIIGYMKRHGLPYLATTERADVFEYVDGPFNRILDFCIRHRNLFDRMVRGNCGGVTRFMMVDDRISFIISHGFK